MGRAGWQPRSAAPGRALRRSIPQWIRATGESIICAGGNLVLFLLGMNHSARQYFWFYGYSLPLAEAWV